MLFGHGRLVSPKTRGTEKETDTHPSSHKTDSQTHSPSSHKTDKQADAQSSHSTKPEQQSTMQAWTLVPRPPPRLPDYHADLGVAQDSSSKQIKAAWRRLLKQYHPDKTPPGQTPDIDRFSQVSNPLNPSPPPSQPEPPSQPRAPITAQSPITPHPLIQAISNPPFPPDPTSLPNPLQHSLPTPSPHPHRPPTSPPGRLPAPRHNRLAPQARSRAPAPQARASRGPTARDDARGDGPASA